MTTLTDTEREDLVGWSEGHGSADPMVTLFAAVEAILDARLAAVRAVVERMEKRAVDHRHEDETGYWGVQGRAYFYAGDIYDDFADLRAVLDGQAPTQALADPATTCICAQTTARLLVCPVHPDAHRQAPTQAEEAGRCRVEAVHSGGRVGPCDYPLPCWRHPAGAVLAAQDAPTQAEEAGR